MDHERVNISQSVMSCGVMELSRIGDDTEDVLYALGSRLYHPARGNPCAFFVFSDIATDAGETSSQRLANEVKRLRLGTIAQPTHPEENPRTGNHITIYVWSIDHDAFKAWYARQRMARMMKVGS